MYYLISYDDDISKINKCPGRTKFPCVPGHELAGVVTRVGGDVKKVAVGDHVGVGCMVDSCGACRWCEEGEEIACVRGYVSTYNSPPQYGHCGTSTGHTMGGYSAYHTVPERSDLQPPLSLTSPHCFFAGLS